MTRKVDVQAPDFVERRSGLDRRQGTDRRVNSERRADYRDGSEPPRPKDIRAWLRSKTNARLGVDRRKGERRSNIDRRQSDSCSLLSQDEINDLLSPL